MSHLPFGRDPQPLLDAVRDQLQTQLDFVDAIDSKVGVQLGVGSALAGILAAVAPLLTHGPGIASGASIALAIGSFASLVYLSFRILWGQRWQFGPQPERLLAYYGATKDDNEVAWEAVDSYAAAFRRNERAYWQKVNRARWAMVGLVVETVALLVGFALLALRD